jgi:hypothetical protein
LPVQNQIEIGHFEVFQGMFFTSGNFAHFANMPQPQFPVGNLDFVIGKRLAVDVRASHGATASSSIVVPAVAVECKTYLDRPRYIESDTLAASLKRGFPGCLYILLSEYLKLDLSKVNIYGSPIDRIFVVRRSQNVDRSIRRAGGTGLTPIHSPAMVNFFLSVRSHLETPWATAEDWTTSGVLK